MFVFAALLVFLVVVVGSVAAGTAWSEDRLEAKAARSFPVILAVLGGTVVALLPSSGTPLEDVRRHSSLRADLAEVAPDHGLSQQTFLDEEQVEGLLSPDREAWFEEDVTRDLAEELEDLGYEVTVADPERLREAYGPLGDDEVSPVQSRRGMTGISLFSD